MIKEVKNLTLNPDVFSIPTNPDLLAQYVRVYQANQRQGNAHTKTRGEVRGGGKKPWRQKGTGRARHGSIRSPIWVGGGTAHGPKARDWSLKMFTAMRKKALAISLSDKVREGNLLVIKNFNFAEPKTKQAVQVLDSFSLSDKKVLVILDSLDKNVMQSCQNLSKVSVSQASDLNAYQVLNAHTLVATEKSIGILEERLLTN